MCSSLVVLVYLGAEDSEEATVYTLLKGLCFSVRSRKVILYFICTLSRFILETLYIEIHFKSVRDYTMLILKRTLAINPFYTEETFCIKSHIPIDLF